MNKNHPELMPGEMWLTNMVKEEYNPLADNADMYVDLLGAALSVVSWYDIAEGIIEELED